MIRKIQSKLWIYFVFIVFIIIFITSLIMGVMVIILINTDYFLLEDKVYPHFPFMVLLFISVLIGTAISSFVAKKILNPISIISQMANEVAKGNFNVRLDENNRIDEINDLNRNFNIMVQELSGIETLRNDFIVNVSHEFKTPIAAIEGYAALLQDKELSETERDEYTNMIIESTKRLSVLSGNILALSKLETQEIIMEKKPYRLDEQIRQAILLLEPQWSAKEIELQIEMPKTVYNCNEGLLMQVWLNIIGNAIKFTNQKGTICIQLTSSGKSTVVRITDNGCGMDGETIKRVFDKFYQGDTARKSEGNGLGLSLVKRIIELVGGKITVTSEKWKGSTFTVLL